MNTILIFSGLLLIIIFFIWKGVKHQLLLRTVVVKNGSYLPLTAMIETEESNPNFTGNNENRANTIVGHEILWWNALDNMDQLRLAVMLAQKGLSVWENYSKTEEISYSNTPVGTPIKIAHLLLEKSIDEIIQQSQLILPGSTNQKINHYYNHFVGPVIAMQDGNWLPPIL